MSLALQTMISAPFAAQASAGDRSFGGVRGVVTYWRAYSETWRLT
jgi:hypothetical protein